MAILPVLGQRGVSTKFDQPRSIPFTYVSNINRSRVCFQLLLITHCGISGARCRLCKKSSTMLIHKCQAEKGGRTLSSILQQFSIYNLRIETSDWKNKSATREKLAVRFKHNQFRQIICRISNGISVDTSSSLDTFECHWSKLNDSFILMKKL